MNDPEADDLIIVREEVVRAVAKRRITLNQDLQKGFVTVYDQCSQEVTDKLESSDGWDTVQNDQSLHQLIFKIERICVGFDDHKQEVNNLVQAMKKLFLYTQTEKRFTRRLLPQPNQSLGNGQGLWCVPRDTQGISRGVVACRTRAYLQR